jgi:NAD-dependent SIR2 family protein deacetylase
MCKNTSTYVLHTMNIHKKNKTSYHELDRSKLQLRQQPSSTHTMQAMLEAKVKILY